MTINTVEINPFAHDRLPITEKTDCVSPSPIGWERARLRATVLRSCVFCAGVLVACLCSSLLAGPAPGPWTPLFKGVALAVGTNDPSVAGNFPRLQVVNCIRIDLTDPDVTLFTTPQAPNAIAESRETLTQTVPDFLQQNQLQVASDANFYSANPGGSDPTSPGLSCEVYGLQISTGKVISAQTSADAAPDPRYASLLFSTNNQPHIVFVNRPPGTNIAGIYNAITGYYPVVSNGVNIGAAAANSYPDSFIHQVQPRTAYGVSQDSRYLFLMTIDGRQPGYSDGALDTETAYWLLQFGAWNGINMDGGGSTAMYMSDSTGYPVGVNHSSYLAGYGRERYIGSHFGVYAKPLQGFINDINASPSDTSAVITWTTLSPATSQVQYGPTVNLGSYTDLSSELVTNHTVVLSGLSLASGYYFQALSSDGSTEYVSSNQFFTTRGQNPVFDFDNVWSFSTANLDGVNWTAPGYDDSGWDGSGPGLLWTDTRGPNGNIPVALLTEMPWNQSTGDPYPTYYFRTHFTLTNTLNISSLVVTDYLDDGAVFYLNGTEVYRLRMPAAPALIQNSTLASIAPPCGGNAYCPDSFSVSGDLLTNLVSGDNLFAVEAHNFAVASPDITFGMSLDYVQPTITSPQLNVSYAKGSLTLSWDIAGFTLQQASGPAGPWADVPGPITSSPYSTSISGISQFYRLRN